MKSADAADAASWNGDHPAADRHGPDQLSPEGSPAGTRHVLAAGLPDDAQKHHEASPSGQAVEAPARNGERIHSAWITDHELTHGTLPMTGKP